LIYDFLGEARVGVGEFVPSSSIRFEWEKRNATWRSPAYKYPFWFWPGAPESEWMNCLINSGQTFQACQVWLATKSPGVLDETPPFMEDYGATEPKPPSVPAPQIPAVPATTAPPSTPATVPATTTKARASSLLPALLILGIGVAIFAATVTGAGIRR